MATESQVARSILRLIYEDAVHPQANFAFGKRTCCIAVKQQRSKEFGVVGWPAAPAVTIYENAEIELVNNIDYESGEVIVLKPIVWAAGEHVDRIAIVGPKLAIASKYGFGVCLIEPRLDQSLKIVNKITTPNTNNTPTDC